VKAVLGDDILLMRHGHPLYHVRLQPATNDVAAGTPLRVHLA
jgi:hypothetical protein